MFLRLFEVFKRPFERWFLITLVVVNFFGSIYGYYWYRYQLADNSLNFWPIIPDSPRSTTFLMISLLIFLIGSKKTWQRTAWFQALAYTGVIKYGIWAVSMITQSWIMGDPVNPTDVMLWFSHLGMALQGVVFLRHLKINYGAIFVPAVWMVFNDYMDYVYDFHPYLFSSGQVPFAMLTAVGLTLILLIVLLMLKKNLCLKY